MRALALALGLALAAAGCGPNVKGIVTELAKSDRSWCFYWAGTPAFSGPFRAGGSGIDGGSATCTAESFTVNQGMGAAGAGGPLLVPRVLVPDTTWSELDTSSVPKRAPTPRRPAPK